MPPQFVARVRPGGRLRWFVVLIAFVLVIACSPLELAQQQPAPTAPPAQALATLPSGSTATTAAPAATTAPTLAPTSTLAPTLAPTTAPTAKYALIAFVSDRDGAPELYTIKPDGTAQTRLTSTQGKDTLPVWSPDGTKIALLSERSGTLGLYVMNADGSNAALVFKDSLNPSEAPAWSPDGKRIAVTNNEKGKSQIFILNADGTGKTRLTDGKADDFGPAWSPDGSKLAFYSRRDKNAQGYTINADGSGLKRMTLDPTSTWLHPVFSPDGKKIALVKTGTPGRIYTMNVDGSALMMLADSDGASTRLAWSPDGKKIVFNRAVNGKDQIFVVNVDGKSAPVALTSAGKNYYPAWCCSASPVTMLDAPQATLVAAQPSATAASKATAASSSSGDPATMVKNALDAMTNKSFRGTIKNGSESMTFEYVPHDNYHIVLGTNEYIILGQAEAYMKADGKWSKTDASAAGFFVLPIAVGCGFADKTTNAKALPNETLNGASMQVVSYVGQYDAGSSMQYKMWIGADGLPRQVTFQDAGKPAGTTTLQYDSSIKVTAPTVP